MNVLVACEFSGTVRDEFIKAGHYAVSCDLLPTEKPGPHYQGDVMDIIAEEWDLLIAHPPCTYLTNAGVQYLYNPCNGVWGVARWDEMKKAAQFFNSLKNAPVDKICIENPIPHKYARALIGSYTQVIQPWQFGHKESKATCLWLKNLAPLAPTEIVGPPPTNMTNEEKKTWQRCWWGKTNRSNKEERWRMRSRTFEGVARAMAAQWGGMKAAIELPKAA